MKKIKRIFKVDYPFDWKCGVKISRIKHDIEELEKLGATHIEIDTEDEYGETYLTIKALSERIETDEEAKQRISEEKKEQEETKRRELEELDRLKSKYGLY